MTVAEQAVSTDFIAGRDLLDWPTAKADQQMAIDILNRYRGQQTSLELPRMMSALSEAGGGMFQVAMPGWIEEMEECFNDRYGREVGWVNFQKTFRWLLRQYLQR